MSKQTKSIHIQTYEEFKNVCFIDVLSIDNEGAHCRFYIEMFDDNGLFINKRGENGNEQILYKFSGDFQVMTYPRHCIEGDPRGVEKRECHYKSTRIYIDKESIPKDLEKDCKTPCPYRVDFFDLKSMLDNRGKLKFTQVAGNKTYTLQEIPLDDIGKFATFG